MRMRTESTRAYFCMLPRWTYGWTPRLDGTEKGLVLVFADNHSEYWKWKGPAPVSWFNRGYVNDPAELEDLKRLQQTAPDVE